MNGNDPMTVKPEVRFKFEDAEVVLTPPSYKTQGMYRHHLQSETIRGICTHMADYPPDVFKMQLGEVAQMFAAKEWNWGRELWRKSLNDDENIKKLVFLVLTQEIRPGAPANCWVTEELVESMWDRPYTEPDEYYAFSLRASHAAGVAPVPTYGGKLWFHLLEFINRPNSQSPPAAGTTGSSTS